MKMQYASGEPVRIGDAFQAPRWGLCIVARIDRASGSAVAVNTSTGEEFDELGSATFGESDLIRRKPENITRARMRGFIQSLKP